MFKFLKDKLKKATEAFSKKVEEEAEDAIVTAEDVKKAARPKKKAEKETEKPAPNKPGKRPEKEEKKSPAKTVGKKEEKKKPEQKKKDVLDKAIEGLGKDVEMPKKAKKKGPEEIELLDVEKPKKGFFSKIFKKKEELKDVSEHEEKEEPKDETRPEEQKKGFFGKLKEGIVAKKLSASKFEELFFDIEVALLENNVAVEVIEKIKVDLKKELVDQKLNRFDISGIILDTLQESLDELLDFETLDILALAKKKKPLVIVFVGVNGSGKTTTIAKMAKYFENNGLSSVLVAADTFRAAAIQQLEEHAKRLNKKIIKHDYGSDPAAVAFDGIRYAEAKDMDVVLIDTAGRLHSNVNLMDELAKIVRVSKPDLKIFIGESITGNDCIEQAQKFNETVKIDGIILSKADVDEKGGAAISVAHVTGKPILFIGTGQDYEDLEPFDKEKIMENLGLERP
ncbi:MAG: signal recognition particle-docking protein FtsY [Candidatus Nanoarchaeia archaeon]